KEQLRVQGLDEPITEMVSSVDQSRALLRKFEANLPELRRMLATGQGWFEVFYVPKRHYKEELIAYAKALKQARKNSTEVPPELATRLHRDVDGIVGRGGRPFPSSLEEEAYNVVCAGPSVKYRWVEGKGPYIIARGLIDDTPPFPFIPEGF